MSGLDGPAFSPSFSPTSSALVLHVGREPKARLVQASLGTGEAAELRPLTDGAARDYHPRVSPDGQMLAFDSDRDGVRGVYVMRVDGTARERVSGPGYAALPSWSPDQRSLAFVRAEPGRSRVWNLWLRDVGTGEMKRLTNHRYGQTWSASWFPDGTRIAYSHETRLVVRDLTTDRMRAWASPVRRRMIRTPAVSPDGTRVVFQVHRDGVWMIDVGTGRMRRILRDSTAEEFAWSPDGRLLAYHSARSGRWRIWTVKAPE
jgi:Tol biopolymer transport system component